MRATPHEPERANVPPARDGAGWSPPPPAPTAAGSVSHGRPSPRLIRSPQDAENAAAEWLRWFGFTDATVTKAGADGGVDVRGRSLVAQVKAHMVPISRPDLQRLYGIAQVERATAIFFSLMHYTHEALEWADQVGMALFRFDHAGEPEAVNSYAAAVTSRAERNTTRSSSQLPPPMLAFAIGCSDDIGYQRLVPRRGIFRDRERLEWVRQGWLPVAGLRYDFTYVNVRGRRTEELFGHTFSTFELLSGTPISLPPDANTVWLSPSQASVIRQRMTPTEVTRKLIQVWDWFCALRQTAAVERGRATLASWGVPPAARTLRVTATGAILLPYIAALLSAPTGNRVTAVEAVTGAPHSDLSALFTRSAPYLLDELYAGRPVTSIASNGT